MISVNQLVVSFGGFDLLKNISFLIGDKDRIGLVGKNGAGKSTMLKIIAGKQELTSGTISCAKDLNIGYLPQHLIVKDTRNVFEETRTAFSEILKMKDEIHRINDQISTRKDYESNEYMNLVNRFSELNERYQILGGNHFEADIEMTLKGLGFKRSDFTRQTSEFSGGWRMRIELAKILLRKPNIFLLDEPTNHLDIESIQWLEDFLKNYDGAMMVVSHDRAFLNNITNRTIEISLGRIYDFKASYDRYLELKEEQRESQIAAYNNQQKLIQDTKDFIARFRYKPTKAVQVQARARMLEKLDIIEIDQEDNSRLNIKFPPAIRSGKIVVNCRHLTKRYGDLCVLKDIDLTIERGEKVAFVGKNGEGKTTLARVILNQLDYEGEMKIGHNVKVGYFAQNQAMLLDDNLTVFETIDQIAVGEIRTKIRKILGAFMFSGDDIDKKVSVLSGGERTRLAMIRLMLQPVNFLVLDEPTNHLDMRSKDMLKKALAEYDGTVLVVSHDRDFLDGLVKCVYEFKDKKIKQHIGGIYEFLREKKLDSLKELERNNKPLESGSSKKKEPVRKLSYEEQKEISRNFNRLKRNIQKEEEQIAQIEKNIADLDKQMASSNEFNNNVFDKYNKLKSELEKLIEKWTADSEEFEKLKK